MSQSRHGEGRSAVKPKDLSGAQRDEMLTIIARFEGVEGAALPILHAVQSAFGYIPQAAVPILADKLNRSRAEIHGVVTFYHDFRSQPAGRHVVKLCRAEACQSMGGNHVESLVEAGLGITMGETTADGRVTLEPVYCLGLCAVAPAAMVDGRVVGRLDAAKARALVAEVEA
ncbi:MULTISPECIES: formate dehydrogenase subunit gamma [unclassified Chelatococcus]|uniref:formate dehydrogenase subunit gamma n=1 Tax=unclassified Chelatococcus TaxID=2638111 RepID=UPI00224BDFE3|nr:MULTISPECIES: formate dehydrogenase subunit gamma [unclassified Chelatococcus]CAH1648293.1 NAD-dependent formate dehydrogenase gamma subunit [Hyphomicrobiales bacterium]CAH1690694.1 NAD-dependent formate dehydrogenase gamma subunit [Hyphomicrobiales bacterium]